MPEASRSPWLTGVRLGVGVGGVTGPAAVVAVGRVWAACDIGVNAAANSLTLVFLAPLAWLAAALPWVALYGTLGRRHRALALAAGLLFSVWFAWFLVTWLGVAEGNPQSRCPGNVPPWWPDFVPT
ncbi:hypothetical protein [Streptomyces griseosporeus]|uniref:hypothetical protein n=1 Tax=Streptomyces griseosporeus TaxID=1910 RepID=UPI00370119C0